MDDERALVTVARASTPFEAQVIATRLRSAGVEAVVFDVAIAGFGTTFRPGARDVPVQVPADQAEAARAELGSPARLPPDARDDDGAPSPFARRMPPGVWVAFVVTALVLVVGLIGAIVMIVL